ncbi:hypothetical protein VTL71DRAFT_7568 [Oculimacula yallundae]|uniref:Fungal N-terminal domain-containing protein n=1 Tax=Oculimacula yallundae TaxID=86028 RepID=A0ABR4BUI0_9HELO
MDPLSITASTVTLIQSTGAVCSILHKFTKTFRNADSRVAALSNQLSRLIKFLETIDRTLRNCRGQLSLVSMEEDLWHQSRLSLEDCRTTLDELTSLVNRIVDNATSSGFFRRAKVATDLTMYAVELAGFEEKIHKSNSALQTMLSAIQVALSLRGNETQEHILFELGNLTAAIDQIMQATLIRGNRFSHIEQDSSDARVNHNLQRLAQAARNFHSSASSTASTRESSSTVLGTSRPPSWNVPSEAAISVMGGPSMTPNKRRQVDQFIKQQRRMTQRRKRKPLQSARPLLADYPVTSSGENQETEWDMTEAADNSSDVDNEADDLETFLLSGHDDVAQDSMLNHEFAKAQSHLEKAIESRTGSTSEDSKFKQLQIRLALCNFFQHRWQVAEPLIDSIAKSKYNFDPVICNLLHALAIANLQERRLEKAVTLCKQALAGKRRLKTEFTSTFDAECNNTLGLLATIYDHTGENVLAEAARRKMSNDFSYFHPESELEFLVNHPTLCIDVVGKKMIVDWRRPRELADPLADAMSSKTHLSAGNEVLEHVPRGTKTTKKPLQTFHTKLNLSERVNMDSAKEVVVEYTPPGFEPDDDLVLDLKTAMESIPSRLDLGHKNSYMRRVTRFLGSRRKVNDISYCDTQRDSPNSNPDDAYPQCSPRTGEMFWSKLKGQKTKLLKDEARHPNSRHAKSFGRTFSFLNYGGRKNRSFKDFGTDMNHMMKYADIARSRPEVVGTMPLFELDDTSVYPDFPTVDKYGQERASKASTIRFGARRRNPSLERLVEEEVEVAGEVLQDDRISNAGFIGANLDTGSTETRYGSDVPGQRESDVQHELFIKERAERYIEGLRRGFSYHESMMVEGGFRKACTPASEFSNVLPNLAEAGSLVIGDSEFVRDTAPPSVCQQEAQSEEFSFSLVPDRSTNQTRRDQWLSQSQNDIHSDTGHHAVENFLKWTQNPAITQVWLRSPSTLLARLAAERQPKNGEAPSRESQISCQSTSYSSPLHELRRKFSWESASEDDGFSATTFVKPTSILEDQIPSLACRFSWDSDDRPGSADIDGSPSLSRSSSSSRSTSSGTTATSATSATSISSNPILLYDPIGKDLIFMADDSALPAPETVSLSSFLEHLQIECERNSATDILPQPKACLGISRKYEQPTGTDSIDRLGPFSNQAGPEQDVPVAGLMNIISFTLDGEARTKGSSANSNMAGLMLNRSHPLRQRKHQLCKSFEDRISIRA